MIYRCVDVWLTRPLQMNVIFDTSKGKAFNIEVGFFDTMLEMKEKIEKYEQVPVDRQTLIFNGQVMADDRDTEFYQVLQGSHIHLLVESNSSSSTFDKPPPAVKVEEPRPPKLSILVKIPSSKCQFSLEADAAETIGIAR
ncbi:hypothetical protein ACLOJK_039423 [Asimina triloba]